MTHLLDSFTDVQDSKNLNLHKSGDDYFIPVLHIPAEMAPTRHQQYMHESLLILIGSLSWF